MTQLKKVIEESFLISTAPFFGLMHRINKKGSERKKQEEQEERTRNVDEGQENLNKT